MAQDPPSSLHRRRPAGRLPLRPVHPSGGVLSHPHAGPAGLGPGVLRDRHPGEPRRGSPRPGLVGLRPAHLQRPPPPHPKPLPHPGDHQGVTPSLHVEYKHTRIKQYHKEGRALRTETTINDTRDFWIGKRLCNLPALREVGFSANRRLLHAQTISHDPIIGHTVFTNISQPAHIDGQRVAGLRFGDARVHALLAAIALSRCQPAGFSNRDLRHQLAQLTAAPHRDRITPGAMTYDLRRLRLHGLIHRIPHTNRYRPTPLGWRTAWLFTHIYNRYLRTATADIADPASTGALCQALDDLAHRSGLTA